MTYDMGSAWFENNWMTWFNAPIYNNQATVLFEEKYPVSLPSADSFLTAIMTAKDSRSPLKAPSTKLGRGIPFYGRIWSGGKNLTCTIDPCQQEANQGGAIQPRQAWTPMQGKPPSYQPNQIDFAKLMLTDSNNEGYNPQNFFWDYETESSYLSIDASDSKDDRFITFEDEGSVERKVRYSQKQNLGGVMIWELPVGYLPTTANPKMVRQPLLNSIKTALTNTKSPSVVIYDNAMGSWKSNGANAKIQSTFNIKTPASSTFKAGNIYCILIKCRYIKDNSETVG